MKNNHEERKKEFVLSEGQSDFVIGAVGLVFALAMIFLIIPGTIADVGKGFPGPRTLPNFYGWILLVLSCCMLFQASRKRKGKSKIYGRAEDTVTFDLEGVKRIAIVLAIIVISVVALNFLPYIPVTIALLFALMYVLGQRKILVLAGISVIPPIVIYFFFTEGLRLVLP